CSYLFCYTTLFRSIWQQALILSSTKLLVQKLCNRLWCFCVSTVLMCLFLAVLKNQDARNSHHIVFFGQPFHFIAVDFIPVIVIKFFHHAIDEHIHPFAIWTPFNQKLNNLLFI